MVELDLINLAKKELDFIFDLNTTSWNIYQSQAETTKKVGSEE